MTKRNRLSTIWLLIFFSIVPMFSLYGSEEPAMNTEAAPSSPPELHLTLQVPIFSPLFAETPVASVNGEPITLRDFSRDLAVIHTDMTNDSSASRENFLHLLDRLISVKLIVLEAKNIGLDETSEVQNKIKSFAESALIGKLMKQLENTLKLDKEKFDKLYSDMAQEVKLTSIFFKKEEDAKLFLEEYENGGDFSELAEKFTNEGKSESENNNQYIKLKNLLPNVATKVFTMESGTVGPIFKTDTGYLVFKIEDKRAGEDPEAAKEARQMVLDSQKRERVDAYAKELEDKYIIFDEEAKASLDFEKIAPEGEEVVDASAVLETLVNDQRPLATIRGGDETYVISVADIAQKLKATFYHGVDRKIDPKTLEGKKETILGDMLFKITAKLEAINQGFDKQEEYLRKVEKFTESLLFETFTGKAIAPDVKLTDKDIRQYYDEHIEEYSSPMMLELKSLIFSDGKNAKKTLEKLRGGSDFKWVSANVTGLVDPDAKDIIAFDKNLLTITSLPAELQDDVRTAGKSDTFLYEDPDKYHYVLYVQATYPPRPEPYAKVRGAIIKKLYNNRLQQLLGEWVEKLKEAYEVRIFIQTDAS